MIGRASGALRLGAKVQFCGHLREAPIPTPEQRVAERCRCEEMGINPTDTAAHQAMALNKHQTLIMAGYLYVRQPLQMGQYFRAASHGTTRQFANDEGVTLDFVPTEQRAQLRIAAP